MLKSASSWRWAAPLLLCICANAQSPVGVLFASDPSAPSFAQPAGMGMTVLPGSELSAGIAPAALQLARGGQVRICPHSQLSVNSGSQGLMLSMNAGALEISYQVNQSVTDLVVTPDFNIRLAGPAAYHFALGLNDHGDTCFKPLPGNTAGIVFSELLGSDVYGVAADEAAFFPEGKLAGRRALDHPCGCPVAVPAMRAPAQPEAPTRPDNGETAERVVVASHEVAAPSPPEQHGQSHMEVETPFVFSAKAAALPGAVAKIDFSALPNMFFVQDEADPVVLSLKPPEPPVKQANPEPSAATKKEKKGFMARLKGFLGSIFHH